MAENNHSSIETEDIAIPYALFADHATSHAAKLTYGRLRLYAGTNGKCSPTHEILAKEIGICTRQLRTVLAELRDAGWIGWQRTRDASVYSVHVERQTRGAASGSDDNEIRLY